MTTTRVCVTGSTRGIGLAVAEQFLSSGDRVVLNYRSASSASSSVLKRLEEKYPGKTLAIRADVSSPEEVRGMFDYINSTWGGLDVLINNAGCTVDGLALMMNESAWHSVISTDLDGVFFCAKQAAWMMMAQGSGVIINISSVSAFTAPVGQSNYAAAKAGVIALTKTLSKELGKNGVRVNAVAPGLIETDMIESLTPTVRKDYLARIPLRRLGRSEEIARTVAFLASDDARYITGTCLVVDGGLTA